jgi:protein phosphatase
LEEPSLSSAGIKATDDQAQVITCPECGAPNQASAKFCDRCGQGLGASPSPRSIQVLTPLPEGSELPGGLRILTLLSKTSDENLYRAERLDSAGNRGLLRLRERRYERAEAETEVAAVGSSDEIGSGSSSVSSTAKTAELKLKPLESSAAGEVTPSVEPLREHHLETEDAPPAQNTGQSDQTNGLALNGSAAESHSETESSEHNPEPTATTPDNSEASAAPSFSDEASESVPADTANQPNHTAAVGEESVQEVSSEVDLGEVFGRVMALSLTLNHPAFERALSGFAHDARVYLIYRDEPIIPLAQRRGGIRMREAEAISVAIQLCQAVGFAHRRGLRVNDICPDSVGYAIDGRIRLTGLDRISNDDELQSEPLYNDGYTAPEIYKGRKVDKRADIFSIGAVLYTCLTGERLAAESWREEAGPIRFYPPHVVTPVLEQAVRRALVFDPAGRWPNVDAFKSELVRLSNLVAIRSSILTDVGMVRELNEDAIMAVEYRRDSQVEPAQNLLYVIADGMGGAEAGEIASAIAVGIIRDYVGQHVASGPPADSRQMLQAALEEANTRILEYQSDHAEARGMGSTAVSVFVVPPDAAVAWVGDSRAYFHDHTGLRQLTKDHSLVQRLIEIGQLTPEEARHHEHKNVITRSLGARQNGPAGAESLALRLKRGDKLLLCSDGLTAHVDDPAINQILSRHCDPDEAARELIVAANAGGGTDNISVVVLFAV